MKNLTIAIDGHASTGKSSIAKELAGTYRSIQDLCTEQLPYLQLKIIY